MELILILFYINFVLVIAIPIYFNVIFRKNTSNKMTLEELKKLKR